MIPNNKILDAQHLASMKKQSFPSHPKVNIGHLWHLGTIVEQSPGLHQSHLFLIPRPCHLRGTSGFGMTKNLQLKTLHLFAT